MHHSQNRGSKKTWIKQKKRKLNENRGIYKFWENRGGEIKGLEGISLVEAIHDW